MRTLPLEYLDYIDLRLSAESMMVPRMMNYLGSLFQNEEGEWMQLSVKTYSKQLGDTVYVFSGKRCTKYLK